MTIMGCDTFVTSASTTRPVNSASKNPNQCYGIMCTETAGAAARVKFYSHAVAKPSTAATAADGAAGNCTIGNHIVKVTFVTAQGETEMGPVSNTLNSAGTVIINVTGIPVATGDEAALVTGRNVYMTEAGGATYYKVTSGAGASIANNTATTISINVDDATLAGYNAAPSANTSGILRADIRLASSSTEMFEIPGGPVSAYLARCEITTGAATSILYGKE